MRVLVIATVFAAVGSCLSIIGGSSANADGLAPTRVCKVVVVGGTFGTQSGVASSGECPGDNSNVPLVVAVGCMSDGTAVVDHVVQSLSRRCKSNVPDCQLLVDGGQSGPNLIKAMEYQRWDPGAHRWINLQFFCPQSSAPVPAGPDLAAIRDRVIRLLPRVAAATTGPNTLVNIQTVLWADTPERRSLGRVLVVGQPV